MAPGAGEVDLPAEAELPDQAGLSGEPNRRRGRKRGYDALASGVRKNKRMNQLSFRPSDPVEGSGGRLRSYLFQVRWHRPQAPYGRRLRVGFAGYWERSAQ